MNVRENYTREEVLLLLGFLKRKYWGSMRHVSIRELHDGLQDFDREVPRLPPETPAQSMAAPDASQPGPDRPAEGEEAVAWG